MSIYIDGEPQSTHLGGTATQVNVYKIGYGLMMMTWTPNPTPAEQAFEAFKTAIDLVPQGQKLFINSGEFYGHNPRTANLELIARFFTKYPELADRCFLSVKGGVKPTELAPDSSPENLRRSVDAILKALDGKKKMDLFECARVDSKVSIEDTITTLKGLVAEGKFDISAFPKCLPRLSRERTLFMALRLLRSKSLPGRTRTRRRRSSRPVRSLTYPSLPILLLAEDS